MWKPSDYIIHGQYCDTTSIRKVLKDIRLACQANGALLLVGQDRTFFQSLLLISHRHKMSENECQALLLSQSLQVPENIPITQIGRLFKELCRREPIRSVADLFLPGTFEVIARKIRVDERAISSPPARVRSAKETQQAYVVVAIVLSNPKKDPKHRLIKKLLDDITGMVNASAPVHVHRNLLTFRNVDHIIDAYERQNPDLISDAVSIYGFDKETPSVPLSVEKWQSSQEEAALITLQAALRLTRSSVGNLYLATPDQRSLKLVAQIKNTRPFEELRVDGTTGVVNWVYKRERPLLINDIEEFRRTHNDIEFLWVGAKRHNPYAELAVPIRQRNFGSRLNMMLGVINIEKVHSVDDGFYTYHDLAILRDLALRFCLWRSSYLFALSSQSLARLTRRNISSSQEWKEDIDTAQKLNAGDHTTSMNVPAEAWRCHADINTTVQQVFDLTRSLSVTVRLLSPDTKQLVRFCGFPNGVLMDRHSTINTRTKGSVNAWVARNGRECYIPDIADAKTESFARRFPGLSCRLTVREGVLAELCLPIFVSGRLVGTMNLESAYKDAFSETRHFALAIAEQVGLSLAHTRQVLEDVIWSKTASMTVHTHDLLKCVSELQGLSNGLREVSNETGDRASYPLQKSMSEQLRQLASNIRSCVESCHGGAVSTPSTHGTTHSIIDEVIKDLNIDRYVHWKKAFKEDLHHTPLCSLALKLAFTMILENAYREAMHSFISGYSIDMYVGERHLGGISYLKIEVVNPVRNRIPADYERSLYRMPILQGDRTHIGAFAAGSVIRAIGGDVYLRVNDGRSLHTVVEIPMSEDNFI